MVERNIKDNLSYCPYCRNLDIRVRERIVTCGDINYHKTTEAIWDVYCPQCGAQVSDEVRIHAVRRWNCRVDGWRHVNEHPSSGTLCTVVDDGYYCAAEYKDEPEPGFYVDGKLSASVTHWTPLLRRENNDS